MVDIYKLLKQMTRPEVAGSQVPLYSEVQIEALFALKDEDGQPYLDTAELVYEISYSVAEKGFDDIYNYLSKTAFPDRRSIILGLPNMRSWQNKVDIQKAVNNYSLKPVESSVKCHRCGGNTTVEIKQIRSGDEGSSAIYTCVSCGVIRLEI